MINLHRNYLSRL